MDFNIIENELNIILPNNYKAVIKNYPFTGKVYKDIGEKLMDDEKKIIKLNLKYREKGFLNKPLPKDCYIFGTVKKDSLFVIRISKGEGIYFLTKEDGYSPNNFKKHLIYQSFKEFVEETIFLYELRGVK